MSFDNTDSLSKVVESAMKAASEAVLSVLSSADKSSDNQAPVSLINFFC